MKSGGKKAYLKDLERLDYALVSDEICTVTNVNYSNDDLLEHTLDVFFCSDGVKRPILIDIHGGGFISHDKKVDNVFCNVMAQKGFVTFALNYRLAYPKNTVFDQLVDVRNAIVWIRDHAASYNADVNAIYIVGHSSGAVLAVAEAMASKSYSGLILDCGLMHFHKKSIAYWGMRNMVFPKNYKKDARYQNLIFEQNPDIKSLPKLALITNSSDELKDMTYYFDELLRKNNIEHRLFDEGSQGHMGIIFNPEPNLIDSVCDYIRK